MLFWISFSLLNITEIISDKIQNCEEMNEQKASQQANIGSQDVPTTSSKDPIWLSRGRPYLTSWGRLYLTSSGRPEMTSRGRPDLTFKRRPSEGDLGRPQDVFRMFPRGPLEYSNLDVPIFFFTFLSELIRLTNSI